MIYITSHQHRKPRTITWEDVIADKIVFNDMANDVSNYTGTITRKLSEIDPAMLKKINIDGMIQWLESYNNENEELFKARRSDLYSSFMIPKATGGFRRIDNPCDKLQNALRKLSTFLTEDCGLLYHTAAFAYVKGRSIVDCLRKHQRNNSNWFLKTDFSGFFPNTTLEFTMKMLKMIFPLSEICKRNDGYKALRKAISLGFLNGGLPQGTVLSPTLTNIICIPIDYRLFNRFSDMKIVYTRYADDMHISAESKFPKEKAIQIINETLEKFGAPWELKPEKTHYGNRKGKNWCLGLLINAQNNISVGDKKKKYFQAALNSFILDTKNNKLWNMEDVVHLNGLLSYYKMVEKEYFMKTIEKYNKKYSVDVHEMFKSYMNGSLAA